MDGGKNIAGTLSAKDRSFIERVYGGQKCFGSKAPSKEQLESIHELTDAEKAFFAQDASDSENLSVQMLYKFQGMFTPAQFARKLQSFVQDQPMLRSGFCSVQDRVVRVVFQKTQPAANVVYRNLAGQSAMEIDNALYIYMSADMCQAFDLLRGPLFRFAVFHTGKDEYAVLLTVVGLLKEHMDVGSLLGGMAPQNEAAKQAAERKTPPVAAQDTDDVRRYWEELLKGLPPMPAIPYCAASGRPFSQKAYRVPGLETYEELLAKKSGGGYGPIHVHPANRLGTLSPACWSQLGCLLLRAGPDGAAANLGSRSSADESGLYRGGNGGPAGPAVRRFPAP